MIFNHRMILFRRTDNGIHRAGLDAQRTTDAFILTDKGQHGRCGFFLNMLGFHAHQIRNRQHGAFAAGNTMVHICFTLRYGLGIGFATGIAALTALGLGQYGINLTHHGIALDMEDARGNRQHDACSQRHASQTQYCCQNAHFWGVKPPGIR